MAGMDHRKKQLEMIDEIKAMGIKDKVVLEAMQTIPRHIFVPDKLRQYAYVNDPLPIGYGQTISQPYTIAFMLEALQLTKNMKVLEIGTGSGYNAALLGYIVGDKGKVISVEIIEELAEFAKKNLSRLNLQNVKVVVSDGSLGYPEEAPYDRIIITAAAPSLESLPVDQLADQGIMVAPVGSAMQEMYRITKKNAKLEIESLGFFRFVPLTGAKGFSNISKG